MSSLNNPAWLQFKPLTPVGKLRTYVSLPAFSYTPNFTVGSELVTQFNFSASQSFYLKNRPAKPSGVNYLLCIKYRVGATVFRYKLWSGVGEIGMDEVPVYSNQIIKKNFVLEVWSVGNAASQSTAINLITSVTQIPTDISTLSDVALAVGAEFNSYPNIIPSAVTLPTFLSGGTGYWRYKPASIVNNGLDQCTSWTNSGTLVGAGTNLTPVGAPNIVAGPDGVNAVQLPNMESTLALTSYGFIFVVFRLTAWTAGFPLFYFYKNGTPNSITSINCSTAGDGSPALRLVSVDNVAAEIDSTPTFEVVPNMWMVASLAYALNTSSKFSVGGSPYTSIAGQNLVVYDRFHIGSATPVCDFAEIIIYNSANTTLGTDYLEQQVWQYLFQTYPSLGGVLPLTFNTGLEWLDNS